MSPFSFVSCPSSKKIIMSKAYIVAGFRSAVGKAGKGNFRFVRPDDLAAKVIEHLVASVPQLDKERIDDVIVGNATPEAEQGLNMGRLVSLMGLNTDKVPGMTVNRYCSSGLETIAIAKAKIETGMADCIIAGGVESMSVMAMGGWRIVPNPKVGKENPTWYWGMGLTAEAVANQYGVSREEQDAFSLRSHEKALNALAENRFKEDIVPIEVEHIFLDENEKRQVKKYTVDADEGPRASTLEALGKLRPVFDAKGSVTAGNSSQTSDGAAFVLLMSEKMVKELQIEPIARLLSYSVVGVEPRIMGIGPVDAIPKAIAQAGLTLNDIDLIELNEAFASQSVAVIREAGLNPEIVNVNGGAIALGHPLGCTGAKLTVQLINELRRRNKKYGIVTMCVGTGQGAAGVIELLK
jgi:acetyl-CoA acyltransferase